MRRHGKSRVSREALHPLVETQGHSRFTFGNRVSGGVGRGLTGHTGWGMLEAILGG